MILSRQLRTIAARVVALSIVAGLVLFSDAIVYCGETQNLEALFLRATTEAGDAYLATRKEILSTKIDVSELLEGKRKSGKTTDERWLAEILLARLNQPEAFPALEQEFHDKIYRYYRAYPDRSVSGKAFHPQHLGGLLIPDEPLPGDDPARYPTWAPIESLWRNGAPQVRVYFESLRVRNSPLWSLLCGEIIMKGWVPKVPVKSSLQATPPAGTVAPQPTIEAPEVPKVPRKKAGSQGSLKKADSTALANRDYWAQALELLGKLGERRTGPHALRILQDARQDDSLRATAAMCLGRLKYSESLPELLVLCESTQVPRHLHYLICVAVIEIDDPNIEAQLRKVVIKLTAKGLKTMVISTPPQMSMGDVLVSHYVDDVERAIQTLAERKILE